MYLRQSTSQDIRFGPFVDSTDGVTPETGLTIAQSDMQLSKDGAAFAQKNAAGNATHDTDGWYSTTLNTTDTATVGELLLQVTVSGALPVWTRWYVVEEDIYDDIFGASAAGYLQPTTAGRTLDVTATGAAGIDWGNIENAGTTVDLSATTIDTVDTATDVTNPVSANVTQISGDSTAADNLEADYDGTGYNKSNSTIGTTTTNTDMRGTDSAALASNYTAARAGYLDNLNIGEDVAGTSEISGLNDLSAADVNAEVDTALADIHLDHLFAADYDPASPPGTATAWANELVESDSGVTRFTANALEQGPVAAGFSTHSAADVWTEATRTLTANTNLNDPSAADIADAVWDEAKAGHTAAGSFGEEVQAHALSTEISALNDVAATDIVSGGAITTSGGAVSTVTDVTNNVSANVVEISGDSTAADNLEAMYDGSGYVDDTAPASRSQISAISASSAALLATTIADNNITGTDPLNGVTAVHGTVVGNVTDLTAQDGTGLEVPHTGNDIDIVFQIDIGSNSVPLSVMWDGHLNGSNDECNIRTYDHDGTAWVTIATIQGQSGSGNVSITGPLGESRFSGSGGEIYIRFTATAQTSPSLFLDRLAVEYANQTVGYSGGRIFIDTNNGTAGTTSFVNGTADNPVDTLADAVTIATALGIFNFSVAAGSSLTLAADSTNYDFFGNNWTLAFGGQTITGAKIAGATISGTYVGTTAILEDCIINTITGPGITMRRCFFNEVDITNNGTGDWYLNDCRSRVAGTGSPTFDFGAGVGSTNVNLRAYSGGLQIENMGDSGTDRMSAEGFGAITLNANCDGGTLALRGIWDLTDNSGNVTIVKDDIETSVDAILVDTGTTLPAILGTPSDLGGGSTLADNLSDVAGATFDTSTDSLEAIRDRGDSAWTTGAGGSPPDLLVSTTIATLASQTSFTLTAGSADDDAYNDRIIIITDQSTSTQIAVGQVSDYTGSTRTVTLSSDPGIFTMAVGDSVSIMAYSEASAGSGDWSTSERNQIRYRLQLDGTQASPATDDGSQLPVDATLIHSDATAAANLELFFDGTGYNASNSTVGTVTDLTNGVDVTSISGDSTAADNAEAFFDGTGYAGTNNVIPTVTTVSNQVTADMTAISGDSTAADNLESMLDGTGATLSLDQLSIVANDSDAAIVITNSHATGKGIRIAPNDDTLQAIDVDGQVVITADVDNAGALDISNSNSTNSYGLRVEGDDAGFYAVGDTGLYAITNSPTGIGIHAEGGTGGAIHAYGVLGPAILAESDVNNAAIIRANSGSGGMGLVISGDSSDAVAGMQVNSGNTNLGIDINGNVDISPGLGHWR